MLLQKHFTEAQAYVNLDQKLCNSHGFIALTSVILIGAVGAAIAISVVLLGLGSSRSGFALQQSTQAKFLANSCAEEALQKLRESVYYIGNETLTFAPGTCEIQTIAGSGNSNRTIQTSGTVGTIKRKVKVVVAIVHPTISITSWQEVADF